MNRVLNVIILLITVVIFSHTQVLAQTHERAEISDKYKWNLEDLYSSDEAWNTAKQELVERFDEVSGYQGKLANSSSELLACLEFNSKVSKEFGRLYSYANMKSDEDVGNSKYLAMKQEIQQLSTDYSSKAAFIRPEIAGMDKDTIDKFIAQKRGLRIYKMPLYDIQRMKAHTLSDKEEKILAEASLLAGGPSSIFTVFSNAELPYPEITLSDGTTARLTKAGYARHRASPIRDDREAVFQAFWDIFTKFKGTFGTQLYANVKKDMFYTRTRGYDSSLHSSLDENNIPTEVYLALIENVTNNLDSFHRYLNLKKRMLGVETLKYSDVYAPVVKGIDLKYTFDEARKLVLDSVKPLGSSYGRVVEKAFKERWIDVYPTPGKRSGGYCNGSAYDVHPYILLNYNGEEIKDDDTRLSLLMNYLDGIKGTVFRQTQFAEFELRIHEKAERSEPLTGDVLSALYGEILKKYYGHDKGICYIDDLYAVEWAYIPHFYYNFYVYQYSTSFTASTALAEKVLSREKGAVGKFIEFISSGGSDYPIDLLKKAGVDMTGAKPFNKTMEAMNRTMDEIEAILNKKGR